MTARTYTWAAEVKKISKSHKHNNVNLRSRSKSSATATVFSTGQMAHTMKVTGVIIRQKGKGPSGMPKAMCIGAILETIWPTGMVNILTLMAQNTKENSETMSKKATARKNGSMEPNTSVAIKTA